MTQDSTPTTMKAIVQDRFGDASVLKIEERPVPAPLPTEVLVRVHAAGVNPVDWKTREGYGMAGVLGQPPFVLGWDVAGVVEQVGFGVTTVAVGDRVFGMPWFPRAANAYSEYITAPSRQLARIPEGLSFEEAAAVPLAALTAWQTLVDTAHVQAGQRVLVTAAAGGVGHFAVQFARHLGATVVATASERNHAWLSDLGADDVVDYHQAGYEAQIRDIDVAIELVGGPQETGLLQAIRPGGLIVAVPGGVSEALADRAKDAGVNVTAYLVEPDGAGLAHIATLIEAGEVRVEVASVYPFDEVARAHEELQANRTRGKVVLRLDAEARSSPATAATAHRRGPDKNRAGRDRVE
jgi:NADPH:quinone reductase-like Zn-dependent oxidoreductase